MPRGKLLHIEYPELSAEYSARNSRDIKTVTVANIDKAWWTCKACAYEFEIRPDDRVRKHMGCPNCAGRVFYLRYPELAKEYDPRNERGIKTITSAANYKVDWICGACAFEYPARVSDRTKNGSGCPNCAGKVINDTNRFSTLYPELAKEYALDLNELGPNEHFAHSGLSVTWRCKENHTWPATINARTTSGNGCPFCDGRLATPERNLAILYPTVAAEFSFEKNFPLLPQQLTPMSDKDVWWKCAQGHEWFNSPASRTAPSIHQCASCSGAKTDETNNLTVTSPELAAQFHPTKNTVSVEEVRWGSPRIVWWICEDNSKHEWEASVAARSAGAGCYYCFGPGVDDANSLAAVNPGLAKEFDLVKNFPLTPETVRSDRKKPVWWIGGCGHSWEAPVSNRTNKKGGTGCPICPTSRHTSKAEEALRNFLSSSKILTNISNDHHNRTGLKFASKKTVVVDILGEANGKKVAVEYDGYRWHSGELDKIPGSSPKRDLEKTQILLDAGYLVIRVRENHGDKLILPFVPITHSNLLQISHDYRINKRDMKKAADLIETWLLTQNLTQ